MKIAPVEIRWSPDMSIYASGEFLKSVGDEYGWLGGCNEPGDLRCILPYTIVHKTLVKMVRFRVETIPMKEGLSLEEEKAFLDEVVRYFKSAGADIIIPATTNTIFRVYPTGAVAAPYGTLILDLDQSEEAIFMGMNSSHRRKIRLAEKAGVVIKNGLGFMETAYLQVKETFKRSSIPFMSQAAFNRVVRGLGDYVRIYVAEHEGAIQGCIVVPFSRHAAYYVYGGSVPQPTTGAMNLLHWEALREFRKMGVRCYDFCGVRIDPEKGSKQEGLKAFKERFGPRLVQGFMWKYNLRPLKSAAYNIGVRLLRSGDIVDAERHKLRPSP
jgi:hypothetical protein